MQPSRQSTPASPARSECSWTGVLCSDAIASSPHHCSGSIDSRAATTAIKKEPLELVDLTEETPSPVKTCRQRRKAPSVIILSSDDEKPVKRARFSPSQSQPQTILISSDSDSSSDLESRNQSESDADPRSWPSLPSTSPVASPTNLFIGDQFESLEVAEAAVKRDAEESGFVMVRGQSYKGEDGGLQKLTMRCKCYRLPKEKHGMAVHPADHREGRSFRTGCLAHVNIRRVAGSDRFYLSLVDTGHNHPRLLAVGGHAQTRPTEQQREYISKYAENGGFSRKHILQMLETEGIGHRLEPRQMTNIINQCRREAQVEVQALGGDIPSVIAILEEKRREDPRWQYRIRMNGDSRVTALWWQSPAQAEIIAKYHDILVNDNSYNRNQYGYPLNVGVAIDGFGVSRNIWYCFQEREDAETHAWVLQCHLSTAPRPPSVFISDKDLALEAAVRETLPFTEHILCLHHLGGNISKNLQPGLGTDWEAFMQDFWAMYRSPSPDRFDVLFHQILDDYPAAASYLQSALYPTRHRWAHAWVSTKFTCGIRTNGRVEVENRVNKSLGGPKTTFLTLFNRLNARTDEQSQKHLVAIRQVCFVGCLRRLCV